MAALLSEHQLSHQTAMIVLDNTTPGHQKAVTYQMANLFTNMPSATVYLSIDEDDETALNLATVQMLSAIMRFCDNHPDFTVNPYVRFEKVPLSSST
jgi:hypothetical protein